MHPHAPFRLACRRPAQAVFCAFITLAPCAGGAAAGDTLTLTASESITFDDNLFRLPSGVYPSALGSSQRSDRIRVDTVGMNVDKAYSLQRFQLSGSLADYNYGRYRFLDFTARNAAARWAWSLTPRLTGNLSVDRRQSLNSFADFRNVGERNINTSTQRRADLDYWLGGPWHLTLAGFRNKSQNTIAFLDAQDSDTRGGQAGMRFEAADGDYLALQWRSSRGRYPNAHANPASLSDNAYRQEDKELLWRWNLAGHSLLAGRLTAIERKNATYAVRNYKGTAGRIDYTWAPTAKTQVLVSALRDYSSYQAPNASYAVTDTLSLAPTWQAGPKTIVRFNLERSRKDFLGSPGLAPGGRSDRQRSQQLSVEWSPATALTLGAAWRHESRRSNAPGLDYADTSVTVSVRLAY